MIIHTGEVEIPEAPLPESALQISVLSYMEGLCGAAARAGFSQCPTTFFFNVTGSSGKSDRAVIVTVDSAAHAALMRDLKAVEIREGGKPRLKLMKFSAGPGTTFGSIFQQMEEMPMTVFSVTCPNPISGEFLFAHFFIRGRSTIQELRKEMHWARFVSLSPDPIPDPMAN